MVSHLSSTGVSYEYGHLKDIRRDANGREGLENPHNRGKAFLQLSPTFQENAEALLGARLAKWPLRMGS